MKQLRRKKSSYPVTGVLLPALGLLGASVLLVPRSARASSGSSFFGTIGVSIAVGTVLGASTLPFYDQPGSHLKNLAYGAGVGAAVGLGAYFYERITGSSDASLESDASGLDSRRAFLAKSKVIGRGPASRSAGLLAQAPGGIALASAPLTDSTRVWLPLVSLTW